MLDKTIADTSQILQKISVPGRAADKIAVILVYATLVYCVVSIGILIGRGTGKVHNVVQIKDKVNITVLLLFQFVCIIGIIAFIVYMHVHFSGFKLSYFFLSIKHLFAGLLLLFLTLFIIAFFIWVTMQTVTILSVLFSENRKTNGNVLGIFVGFYDIVSGFFWTVLVAAAFSFSIAFIVVVIALILLSIKTDRIYYEDD